MVKRNASPGKLTICLSETDEAWLKDESEKLGCDLENLVRIMIRQRMAPVVMAPLPPNGGGYRETYYDERPYSPAHAYNGASAHAEPEPPPVADVEVPADPDGGEPSLDQLMSATPSILDRAVEQRPARRMSGYRPKPRFQPAYAQQPARNVVPFRPPYAGGAHGAFSLTQFVGLSENVARAPTMGDGFGNVLRQNSPHFGFSNGSRRG